MTQVDRRQRAFILALLVFFFSAFPIKRAEALGFFLIPLTMGITTSALMGAVAACEVGSCFSPTNTSGQSMLYATISDSGGNSVRVPLSKQPASTPPAPSAPATASGSSNYSGGGVTGGSVAEVCATWASKQASQCWPAASGSLSVGSSSCTLTFPCNTTSTTIVSVSSVSCSAGYSASGSTCVLTNARNATDDKTCDLLLSGGQFATASDMNCPTTTDGSKVSPMVRDGKVTAYGMNSKGQPLMFEVTPGSDQIVFKTHEQVQTATQSQVKTSTSVIDATTGAVISNSISSAPGSISSPTSSSVPTTITGTTASDGSSGGTTPSNTPGVSTGTGQAVSDSQFPSDYARSSDIANSTSQIKGAIDGVGDKLTNSEEVGDPTVPDWADGWTSTFNPLKSWSMAGHASVCPTGGFSWNGEVYLIDSHCQLYENHSSSLQTASIVVWTIAALFVLLGA